MQVQAGLAQAGGFFWLDDWHLTVERSQRTAASLNRLNVAISRARGLAILVASPSLLTVPCRTPEQVRLINALCRYVELAEATDDLTGRNR